MPRKIKILTISQIFQCVQQKQTSMQTLLEKKWVGSLQLEPKCQVLHIDPNIVPSGKETAEAELVDTW